MVEENVGQFYSHAYVNTRKIWTHENQYTLNGAACEVTSKNVGQYWMDDFQSVYCARKSLTLDLRPNPVQ